MKPASSAEGWQRMSKMWKARNSSINITLRNAEETPEEAPSRQGPRGADRTPSRLHPALGVWNWQPRLRGLQAWVEGSASQGFVTTEKHNGKAMPILTSQETQLT